MKQIILNHMKIIYTILLLMNFLGAINGKNESKNNIVNFEKTFAKNEKRKLELENYIIVIYGMDVQYSSGFTAEYRIGSINYIEYENVQYRIDEALSISANKEMKIYIFHNVTSLSYFFDSSYDSNVKQIISVDFSNFNSLLITGLKSMFFACSSLQTINFRNFITSNVEDMSYMFDGCTQLQSLDLSSFDTSKAIRMMSMFQQCIALKSLDLSNFNTPLLQQSVQMFDGCTQLESIILSNFKSSLIKNPNKMFKGCTNLKYLDIQNCDDVTSTSISSMFDDIDNLKYINIYNVVSNGYLATAISNALNDRANL